MHILHFARYRDVRGDMDDVIMLASGIEKTKNLKIFQIFPDITMKMNHGFFIETRKVLLT